MKILNKRPSSKKTILSNLQKENMKSLGIKVETEKEALKILRKRKTFKNIFGKDAIKEQSKSDKILTQY